MLVTFRIAERRRARGTIALASFFLAAQLGKKIAARQAIRQRKADEAYQDWLRQSRDRAYVDNRYDER